MNIDYVDMLRTLEVGGPHGEVCDAAADNIVELRSLLRMVLANLRNPILGGLSGEQVQAIDEALGYPFDT